MSAWVFRSLAILVAIACVGGFGALVLGEMDSPVPDASGCVAGSKNAHNVLLIDTSDPIPPHRIEALISLLAEVFDSTPQGARFSLYFVGNGSDDFLLEQISVCQPSSGGVIYRQRRRDQLLASQKEKIRALEKSVLNRSPIQESIEALLNRREVFEAETVRLWIVSDFLENGLRSFYPGSDRYLDPGTAEVPAPRLKPQGRLSQTHLLILPSVKHDSIQERAVPFFLAFLGRYSDTPPQWELF